MNSRQRTLGHAAALMTILIWGTTFVSTKVLLRDFTPVTVLFTRFVIGYAFLWCLRPRLLPLSGWKKELLFAGAGLTGVTLYFLLENIALTYTFASNVGIIVAVVPFFTALLAHFLLKGEGFSRRFFLGFAAAFTGTAFFAAIFFTGATAAVLPASALLALASRCASLSCCASKRASTSPITSALISVRLFSSPMGLRVLAASVRVFTVWRR